MLVILSTPQKLELLQMFFLPHLNANAYPTLMEQNLYNLAIVVCLDLKLAIHHSLLNKTVLASQLQKL